MKIFRDKDGRIYQLADEKDINEWDAEMPLIFIGFIREKQLPNYPKSIRKDIEDYLNKVLKEIAIPKLLNALKSPNLEERKKVAKNFLEISKKNPQQLKIAIQPITEGLMDKNKEVRNLLTETLKNYNKYIKRQKTAKKREKLKKLRDNLDKLEREYVLGKISDQDYLKKQKEFLELKYQIEQEEKVD